MEIRRADPKLRRIAVLLIVACAVVGAVVLLIAQTWLSGMSRAGASTARAELLAVFDWLVGVSCIALLAFGIYSWRSGAHVIDAAQFPPPGMSVVRDTAVLRGAAAIRRGRIMQGLGVVIVLCCLALAIAAWRLHSVFSPHTL